MVTHQTREKNIRSCTYMLAVDTKACLLSRRCLNDSIDTADVMRKDVPKSAKPVECYSHKPNQGPVFVVEMVMYGIQEDARRLIEIIMIIFKPNQYL